MPLEIGQDSLPSVALHFLRMLAFWIKGDRDGHAFRIFNEIHPGMTVAEIIFDDGIGTMRV